MYKLKIIFTFFFITLQMNFPDFPLYFSIKNYSKKTENLTDIEKQKLITLIKNSVNHKIIYALIRCYYLDNEPSKADTTTEELVEKNVVHFNGKILKTGIRYDINSFPSGLQHMLLHFLQIE